MTPASLHSLPNLHPSTLSLVPQEDHRLPELSDSVFEVPGLLLLHVGWNLLTQIDPRVEQLRDLKVLEMTHNYVRHTTPHRTAPHHTAPYHTAPHHDVRCHPLLVVVTC